MWYKILVLLVLIFNFTNPKPYDASELPPTAPFFTEMTKFIGSSRKILAFCTSDGIKLSNELNIKQHKVIDLRSCDNSSDMITTNLLKIISDAPLCFIVLIRSNTTNQDLETKLVDFLEGEVYGPIILAFYNNLDNTESSYIIDKGMNSEFKKQTLNQVKNFVINIVSRDEDFLLNINQNLKGLMISNCSLCLKLAQSLDMYLKINETDINDYNYNADCFKALLDLPNEFNFSQPYDNAYELFHRFTIEVTESRPLRVEKLEEIESVDQLYSHIKVRVNFDGFTAIALKSREFEVFEYLIHADFPFPKFLKFNETSNSNITKRISNYIQELEDFHQSIIKADLVKVRKFITSNPHLIFARNTDNKSALKAAFDSNQMEIFSYLRSAGMNFANIREYAEYYNALDGFSIVKKEQIRQFNLKFLKPASEFDVVTKLTQKSSFVNIHHKAQDSKVRKAIKQIFEDLNSIHPELLEIAAASNELRLVFDFLDYFLDDFDPTLYSAAGSADDELDLIVIAARGLLSEEPNPRNSVLGTLSHELAHYVMTQIYRNELNPYGKKDFERKMKFTEIFNKYESLQENDAIIEPAYKNYENKLKHCELIARTVQMLSIYHNNPKLDELKIAYKDLFNFYDQYVLADMREFIPTMYTREKVRELNSWLDLVAEIESYEVENPKEEETETNDDENTDENDENKIDGKKDAETEEEEKEDEEELPEITEIQEYLDEDSQQRLKVFTTENPKLILQKFYYNLRKSKKIGIFVKSSFSKAKNFESVFSKIDTVGSSVPLIVYCDQVKKLNEFVKMLEKTTFRKVVVIVSKNEFDENLKVEEIQKWFRKIEL